MTYDRRCCPPRGNGLLHWRQSTGKMRGVRAAHAPLSGFTLIELMVVLALVAVVTGAAALALPDSNSATLDREAARLSAQLESARAESRISGVAIQWISTVDGFRFDPRTSGQMLADQRWSDVGIKASPGRLILGPEPVIAAQQVILSLGGHHVILSTDGVGPFVVAGP